MKENKLTKRMNPIFGDNIAKWEIHKQLFGVRSFLTGNTKSVSRWNETLKNDIINSEKYLYLVWTKSVSLSPMR